MSAAEIVYGLPLAFPEANPFLLIGSTFRQRLYPTMSAFYMNSMIALHVLFLL